MRRAASPAAVLSAALLLGASGWAAGPAGQSGGAPEGEKALQMRLLAPCCYKQTLDAHESPLARELRAEIRRRLAAGEPAAAVERDLVARYGQRMVASPQGDPLPEISVALLLAAAVAAAGLVVLLRRWARARVRPPEQSPGRADRGRDQYDERIDAALRDLDE